MRAEISLSISLCRCLSGQLVCLDDPLRPCYKIAYFHDISSRVAFREARQACKMDGGSLLSIDSPTEQRDIENLLQVRQTPGYLHLFLLFLPSSFSSSSSTPEAAFRSSGRCRKRRGHSGWGFLDRSHSGGRSRSDSSGTQQHLHFLSTAVPVDRRQPRFLQVGVM